MYLAILCGHRDLQLRRPGRDNLPENSHWGDRFCMLSLGNQHHIRYRLLAIATLAGDCYTAETPEDHERELHG